LNIIEDIHPSISKRARNIIETNTFNSQSISLGGLRDECRFEIEARRARNAARRSAADQVSWPGIEPGSAGVFAGEWMP